MFEWEVVSPKERQQARQLFFKVNTLSYDQRLPYIERYRKQLANIPMYDLGLVRENLQILCQHLIEKERL